MAVSSGNLDGLLNLTVPVADNQGLTVESFASAGSYPNATLASLTADVTTGAGPSGVAGGQVNVIGVDDASNDLTLQVYDSEGILLQNATEYVLGFSGDSILVSGNDSNTIVTTHPYGRLSDDLDFRIFSAVPLAAGTTVDFTASGSANIACFVKGTFIRTVAGDVPVEALAAGDLLVTLYGTARPVRWIGRRSFGGRFLAANPRMQPVRFHARSLGDGLPRRDLLVSPEHAMFLDGLLIPALCLVNGATIVQERNCEQVEYFHVELDSHDVLLAEGAPSESFVDDDSRGMFQNAAEYRLLYPDASQTPARYCAPRVEEGEALDAVQRHLAALACPVAGQGTLRGYLDTADCDTVTGWACNLDAPGERVSLRVIVDGTVVGEVVADQERPDLHAVGEGDGRHAFSFIIPGGLSPQMRHTVEVMRAIEGQALHNSPMVVEPTLPLALATPPAPSTPLAGVLDHCDRDRIVGWAWQPGTDAPVALQVLDNGVPLVRILANLHRPDLRPAGIGNGRHGFDITVPGGLSPLARHVLEFRRELDGASLPGTPVVIEPAHSFDPALEGVVARAVASLDTKSEQDRVLSFLVAQTERLLQRRATAASGEGERQALAQFRRRWGPGADRMANAPKDAGRRALVIDNRLPAHGRDAGSEAVLSHMQALQALGYQVSIVAADELVGSDAALSGLGITCHGLPAYASVEDVLRRHAGCFDLIYLHRAAVAARYLQLARQYGPRAQVIYNVADLHHVRMARQAASEDRPDLLAASRGMRLIECTAALSVDAVITHSTAEAVELRRAVPGASVHVVPWAVPVLPQPRRRCFADRSGVAFIGHGAHAPNVDAARWLVQEIMPLVWQVDAAIECLLVGSALPDSVWALAGPGVTVLGHVPDLRAVFDRVRLTVAPLRFGAGVKGKVLTSLAARTPCIMTPVAAEGLHLPPQLRNLIAEDATDLASLIARLHADEALIRATAKTGADMMRRTCSKAAVTTALEGALNRQARFPEQRAG